MLEKYQKPELAKPAKGGMHRPPKNIQSGLTRGTFPKIRYRMHLIIAGTLTIHPQGRGAI